MTSPIRPTDEKARDLAGSLIDTARFAALATLDDSGNPATTRIAFGTTPEGHPCSLISKLSQHTQALQADPRCSLLIGEPGAKGDPLTHPRLTLQARADLILRNAPEFAPVQDGWLKHHPKSQLYIGFADFLFARFTVLEAFLNGGFGKAFHLSPADLRL